MNCQIKIKLILLTIAIVNLQASENGWYAKSYAIVMGIDDYRNIPHCATCVNDANAVADLLKTLGFKVKPLINRQVTRRNLSKAIREIADEIEKDTAVQKKPIRFILYFSGHGIDDSLGGLHQGAIVPFDSTEEEEPISHVDLVNSLKRLKRIRHKLVVLDACFGGLMLTCNSDLYASEKYGSYTGDIKFFVENALKGNAFQIITAGGPNEKVLDNYQDGKSYFTYHLINVLANTYNNQKNGYLTIENVCTYLHENASIKQQSPVCGNLPSHGTGEFIFKAPYIVELNNVGNTTPPSALSERIRREEDLQSRAFDSNNFINLNFQEKQLIFTVIKNHPESINEHKQFASLLLNFDAGVKTANVNRKNKIVDSIPLIEMCDYLCDYLHENKTNDNEWLDLSYEISEKALQYTSDIQIINKFSYRLMSYSYALKDYKGVLKYFVKLLNSNKIEPVSETNFLEILQQILKQSTFDSVGLLLEKSEPAFQVENSKVLLFQPAYIPILIKNIRTSNIEEPFYSKLLKSSPKDFSATLIYLLAIEKESAYKSNDAIRLLELLKDRLITTAIAPNAMIELLKRYNLNHDTINALNIRKLYFENFCVSSTWQKKIKPIFPELVQKVDSTVIAIGNYLAINYSNSKKDTTDHSDSLALCFFEKNMAEYPNALLTIDAAWNYAFVLFKTNNKPGAYYHFITFSNNVSFDFSRREMAAFNAVSIAQSLLLPDSLNQKDSIGFAETKLLEAVNNYTKLFPNGTSLAKVLFILGGIYFNHHLFDKAAEVYQRIIESPQLTENHTETRLLLGYCRFGQELWADAAVLFESVWKKATDEKQRTTAYNYLIQSYYFNAKSMLDNQMYVKAAEAFKSIDDKFPGSEYGDIVLFNAAEAWEKNERWLNACDLYSVLVDKYPQSKFAPDALFNTAADFEKAEKFLRAAETYEIIVTQYPSSDKAMDALFNLGLCYEKIGRIDAMVDANERYCIRYPEEKDAEAMLLRSANYYTKSGLFDKATNLYRNFIRRYPQNPKTVEAYYTIGQCQFSQGDSENARLSYYQAELQNARLVQSGITPDYYFASEAALQFGILLEAQFARVQLELPEAKLKTSLKRKTDLLTEAANAYQRVMQYQSEKMFEAAFRIGKLYEDLADALVSQEREKLDPIRTAMNENDILTVASSVLQHSFVPYRKAIELAAQFDSLGPPQKEWVEKSRRRLEEVLLQAGTMLYEGVGAMQNAPDPDLIEKTQPLLHYQYRNKVLETVEPLKMKVLNYFTALLDTLPKLHLDDSLTTLCEINIARLNFQVGSAYNQLATEILHSTKTVANDLPDNEREDLLFQLEDIVFELQDKALERFEAARQRVVVHKLQYTDWNKKIMEALARLNPEKYGASYFPQEIFVSDETWFARPDSVSNWNTRNAPSNGWTPCRKRTVTQGVHLPTGTHAISGDTTWRKIYIYKNIFCPGQPRDATIAVWTPGKYKSFVNGTLVLSDTVGTGPQSTYDSANGIVSLLKGGDNIIACELNDTLSARYGVAISLRVFVDTTEHFVSYFPKNDTSRELITSKMPTSLNNVDTRSSDNGSKILNRRDLIKLTKNYRDREQSALSALRKERLEVQKLRMIKESRKQ